MMNLKIKKLRKKLSLSAAEVASSIGISRPTYEKIEEGSRDLQVGEAIKLANLFRMPFNDLVLDTSIECNSFYNIEKYKQIILFCIKQGGSLSDGLIPKTKLAKLLYLADFGWFYGHLKPMTGLQYRRIQQGPVPDEYFRVVDELFEEGAITIKPSGQALMIGVNESSDQSKLSVKEKKFLNKICKEWRGARTEEIVQFTHKQLPYQICRKGEIIPYALITQEEPNRVYQRPLQCRI